MTAHGVGSLHFEFDRAKRRVGATHYVKIGATWLPLKITISKHWVALLPEEEIRLTLLHEIAHALAGKEAGHGPHWKAMARKVGARPVRCKPVTGAQPDRRIEAKCLTCGEQLGAQHRLPLALYVCRKHRRQPLTWYRDGIKVPVWDMPAKYIARIENARKAGVIDG